LFELTVGAFGQVDRAHPAAPDLVEQPVRSHLFSMGSRDLMVPLGSSVRTWQRRRYEPIDRIFADLLGLLVGFEQAFDFAPHVFIVGAGFVEEGRAFVGRHVESF